MHNHCKNIVFFFLFSIFSFAQAQQTNFDDSRTVYQNEWTIGAFIHTRGWGIDYKNGKSITGFKRRIIEAELLTMNHPKQLRQYNPYYSQTKGYFYGKMNHLYLLRLGIGLKNTFLPKQSSRGVSISYIATGGLSLGFAKPIYLVVGRQYVNPYKTVLTVGKYNPKEDFVDNIYGRASWFKGVNETKVYPGLYAKLGLNFEYGNESTNVSSLEVGMALDGYGKKIPIMAPSLTKNHQFFYTLYINLKIGERKNDH